MEPNNPFVDEFETTQLSPDAKYFLQEAARWARLVAIGGIVLGIVGGMGFLFAMMLISGLLSGGGKSGIIALISLAGVVAFFMPMRYLLRFSNQVGLATENNDSELLNEAFRNLWLHYRFVGIAILATVGLYVLGNLI